MPEKRLSSVWTFFQKTVDRNEVKVIWDRFGIDNKHTGVGFYAEQLRLGLIGLGLKPELTHQSYFDFFYKKSKILWNMRRPIEVRRNEANRFVYHGLSNFNLPFGKKSANCRYVLTVHDIIPLICPDLVSKKSGTELGFLLPKALSKADAVIAVSGWTADTLKDRWPEYSKKLHVIRNGIGPFIPSPRRSKPPMALCVSRGEGYKRLELLAEIVARDDARNFYWQIVTDCAGEKLLFKKNFGLTSNHNVAISVGVSEAQLNRLYENADILVQPSLYEGFSLPVAEALRRAIPVVYASGNATDEFFTQSINLSMSPSSHAQDWLEKMAQSLKIRDSVDWIDQCKEAHSFQHSWNQTAKDVNLIYRHLLET